MIRCTSINEHIRHPEGYELVGARAEGNLFCLYYTGPTRLRVYYTTDFGRELFRVEQDLPWQWIKRVWLWQWLRNITKRGVSNAGADSPQQV